jgi:hypothetical protein
VLKWYKNYDKIDKYIIITKGDSKKIDENNFIKIGIFEEWMNENTKGDQIA